MPNASIVIAAHNEGDLLWKTVQACHDTCNGLDYEIVVADDASTDQCVDWLLDRYPDVSVHELPERRGPSPAKDLAARHAQGDVLVFLDAHCKPEPGAIRKLIADVAELEGQAIVTPTVAKLDPQSWTNDVKDPGHGYLVDLEAISWRWIPLTAMRPHDRFFETPTLIGCCFAISKQLYEKLWGFDRDMYVWGVEDVDFGVKCWLLGHPVLHDPEPVIGHRFQKAFEMYLAPNEYIMANRLRMANKVLSRELWQVWLESFRNRYTLEGWHRAWDIFTLRRGSAELERVYLSQKRQHDEVWYARQFGLRWPLTTNPNLLIAGN